MKKDTFCTLLFMGPDIRYRAQQFIDRTWSIRQFCRVYHVPLREMMSRDKPGVPLAQSLADELIRITAAAGWVEQFKRPLRIGDIMMVGSEIWAFCREPDAKKLREQDIQVITLPLWDKVVIANIRKPCNERTAKTST